ncbi:MAG: peptidylprolyl isomerase [Planctomycetota bacterium]|jgi:cyclophilin family peptidyl-prolyl cis-trans isomerase
MISKWWFCGMLMAAVTICGCSSEVVKEPVVQAKTEAVKEPVVQAKTEAVKEPAAQAKTVELKTSMGDIVIELDDKAAPVTVKNFLRYVEDGFYDGTIFHRVIHRFMIQGGGLTPDMEKKQKRAPIVNEASNGLKNKRGTIAMAQSPENPDSATSQFFINHMANPGLDYIPDKEPGYAVFGRVINGMDVVDAIAFVDTTSRAGRDNVPVKPVVIESARIVSQ